MRVVIIRSNPVKPIQESKGSRSINWTGNEVCVLAWDRQANYSVRKETLSISSADTDIFRIVFGQNGGGIRQNWLPRFDTVKIHPLLLQTDVHTMLSTRVI